MERKIGKKGSADIIAHHIHAKEGDENEVMRCCCNKCANGMGILEVKSIKEKKLPNKKGANQRQEVLGRLVSQLLKRGINYNVKK